MKRKMMRLVAVLLSAIFAFQALGINAVNVIADEEDNGFINPVYPGMNDDRGGFIDPVYPDWPDDPEPDPEPDPGWIDPVYPIYGLGASQNIIHFDTRYEGNTFQGTSITISNYSNVYVDLGWDQTGADVFTVSADYGTSMGVGESTSFSIYCDDGISAGDYSGSVTIYPMQDGTRSSQITVSFYVSVLQNTPDPVVTGIYISPKNASVEKGQTLSFSYSIEGYDIQDWSVNWGITGANSSGTTVDGNGNVVIASDESASSINVVVRSNQDPSQYTYAKVNIKAGNVQIGVQADPPEGGVVTGGGTYAKGSKVSLNASANNGYVFTGWTLNGSGVANTNRYDINNANSSQNYVATFRKNLVYVQTYVSPSQDAGTVTASNYYSYGSNTTLTANPAPGYRFAGWKEDDKTIGTDKTLTLNNITSDRKITAYFEKSQATVQLILGMANAGTVTGAGTYNLGTDVKVTANPYKGYVFNGWFCNNQLVSTNTTYVIKNIDKDYCLAAGFAPKDADTYTITSSVDGNGGTISPNGKVVIPEGIPVTYTITPDHEYKIAAVTVDNVNVGTNNSYTFTGVTANHTIKVKFEKKNETDNATVVSNDGNVTAPTAADINESDIPADLNVDDVIPDVSDQDYIVDDSDVDYCHLTGILAKYDITRDEARAKLESGEGGDLFYDAYMEGFLQMTVNSDFSSSGQATATGDFFNNPTIRNYDAVMASILSEDDLLDALEGKIVSINFDITDYSNSMPWKHQKSLEVMADKYNFQVDRYFDISVIKTAQGVSSLVNNFNGTEAEIVLKIPQDLLGKELSIMHIHTNEDGTIENEILKDIDNNPDTFTFKVSKLSVFAFVEPHEHPVGIIILKLVVIVVLIALMGLIVFVIVRGTRHVKKHKKNKTVKGK